MIKNILTLILLLYCSLLYCSNKPLTQQDFINNELTHNTITLSEPGNYYLMQDISFTPQERNTTAIIIDADNVHLDLNGHALRQENTTGRCVGIKLTTGHQNVSILNGAIQNFTEIGIIIEGGNKNIFLGNENSTLLVTSCGYGSTYAFKDDVTDKPMLQGGIRLGESKAMAAKEFYTYHGILQTVQCTNVLAEQNSPCGMFLGVGTHMKFKNCSFSRTYNDRQTGIENGGGFITSSQGYRLCGVLYTAFEPEYNDEPSRCISFIDCHSDEHVLIGKDEQSLAGYAFYTAWHDLQFRNCTANGSIAPLPGYNGMGVWGFAISGGNSTIYENCTANNNVSTFQIQAFHHSGVQFQPKYTITNPTGIVYRNCQANNNCIRGREGSSEKITLRAFASFFSNDITMEHCIASNNTVTAYDAPNAICEVSGFRFSGLFAPHNGRRGLIRNCYAAGNSTNAEMEGSVAAGYWICNSRHIVLDSCVSIANNKGEFPTGQIQAGILVHGVMHTSNEKNILIKNCSIENENVGILISEAAKSMCDNNTLLDCRSGIILNNTEDNWIKNNTISNVQIGIQDLAAISTNFFSYNQVCDAIIGYDVLYPSGPLPIKTTTMAKGVSQIPLEDSSNVLITNGAEKIKRVITDNKVICASLEKAMNNW